MKKLLTLTLCVLLFSCSEKYTPAIEAVLKQAGKNCSELEKVLKYYAQKPADSLKLRAAEFLIVNMPGKYSEYFDAPWNDVATVCLRWTSSSDIRQVLDTYGLGEPVKQEDVEHITAAYLINNIELAFKVWREQPWGKHVPFDVFCEEILPYRLDVEPLENWREKALSSFADLNKSFGEDSTITAVTACNRLNAMLPGFRMDKDFPSMNYSQMMASARGTCDAMAALAVFAMRALGIPTTYDFTVQWPRLKTGHSWNSVCDSAGRHISFMGTQSGAGEPHQGNVFTKSKAYRKMFARQNNIKTEEANIPSTLNDPCMKDISHEHEGCMDVTVPVHFPATVNTGYAYLATLFVGGENNMWWKPIAWGKVENGHIHYASTGKKLLYLPVYYVDNQQTPAGYPFYLDDAGKIHSFEPDSSFRAVSLCERGAHFTSFLTDRMKQGRFEAANRSDFSDAKTLHLITAPMPSYNEVQLEHPVACRYIRYVSPPGGYCNVAEIEFYGANGKELNGKPVGTSGSYKQGGMTFDKAFDGNMNTFYDASGSNPWTGMDFGKRTLVSKIRYHPRRNVMNIDPRQTCELLYWNSKGWQSLGQQTAEDACLSFNIPGNALFYMRTIGATTYYESIFVMENGIPKWLYQDVVNW